MDSYCLFIIKFRRVISLLWIKNKKEDFINMKERNFHQSEQINWPFDRMFRRHCLVQNFPKNDSLSIY